MKAKCDIESEILRDNLDSLEEAELNMPGLPGTETPVMPEM